MRFQNILGQCCNKQGSFITLGGVKPNFLIQTHGVNGTITRTEKRRVSDNCKLTKFKSGICRWWPTRCHSSATSGTMSGKYFTVKWILVKLRMTGSEKNGNGTAEFKGLLNDRISWDGCMDKKERLTTRNGIKEKVSVFFPIRLCIFLNVCDWRKS